MTTLNKNQFEQICRYLVDDFYSDEIMEKLLNKPFDLSECDLKQGCTMILKIIQKEAQTTKFIQRSSPILSEDSLDIKMEILRYFKRHPDGITSKELASRFGFSPRTGNRKLKEFSEKHPKNVIISGKKEKKYIFTNVDEIIQKLVG